MHVCACIFLSTEAGTTGGCEQGVDNRTWDLRKSKETHVTTEPFRQPFQDGFKLMRLDKVCGQNITGLFYLSPKQKGPILLCWAMMEAEQCGALGSHAMKVFVNLCP